MCKEIWTIFKFLCIFICFSRKDQIIFLDIFIETSAVWDLIDTWEPVFFSRHVSAAVRFWFKCALALSVHPGATVVWNPSTVGCWLWESPSSRLHQWHGLMWVSFLGGSSHSANQGKQATLYLMIISASVPYLSSLCESRQTRAQMHSQELSESHPAERLDSGFHRVISSQFNQI